MNRSIATLLIAGVLALTACTFDAGDGGYVFKQPKDTIRSGGEDTPPDPGPDLGQACFDFFTCILSIDTQGGTVDGCAQEAPEDLTPYLNALQTCATEHCNDLKFNPESPSFVSVAFRNCVKFNCSEPFVGCFAHAENQDGCSSYVMCSKDCAETGVACDLTCMTMLSPDDVAVTVDYLQCMKELAEIPDTGITEKLCECLGLCEVLYPECDEAGR